MITYQAPMHYYKFNEDGAPIRSDFHFSDGQRITDAGKEKKRKEKMHGIGENRMTFEEWVEAQDRDVFLDYSSAKVGWEAAQKAERKKVKRIVQEVGVQGNHDEWFNCCDTIMERIGE